MGDDVGKAFVQHYYSSMKTGAAALAGLYKDGSMLTFEGQQFKGAQAIIEKLQGLGPVAFDIPNLTVDCQPGKVQDLLLILVTGRVAIDGGMFLVPPLYFFSFSPFFSSQTPSSIHEIEIVSSALIL